MNNILIDTNVLIYAKDKSSLFHSWTLKVIRENHCFVTSKNLAEYYTVVTRGVDPTLAPEEAKNDLIEFSKRFKVLFPNQRTSRRLLSLVAKHQPKGLKIHDLKLLR